MIAPIKLTGPYTGANKIYPKLDNSVRSSIRYVDENGNWDEIKRYAGFAMHSVRNAKGTLVEQPKFSPSSKKLI